MVGLPLSEQKQRKSGLRGSEELREGNVRRGEKGNCGQVVKQILKKLVNDDNKNLYLVTCLCRGFDPAPLSFSLELHLINNKIFAKTHSL